MISQISILAQYRHIQLLAENCEDEKDFRANLTNFIAQFEIEDRKEIIKLLQQQYPEIRCLTNIMQELEDSQNRFLECGKKLITKAVQVVITPELTKFQILDKYNQARLVEDDHRINELLNEQRFYEYLEFPIELNQIRNIIVALKQDSLRIFNILEFCQKPNLSLQINFLHDLLHFLLNPLSINHYQLIQLLKFFGEATSKLIIQFQYLLEELTNDNQKYFQEFVSELQSVQIGQKDISTLNRYRERSYKYDLIVQIATLRLYNTLEYWQEQIQSILKNTQLKINVFDAIMLNPYDQAEQIYFLTLFTLWYLARQEDIQKFQNLRKKSEIQIIKKHILEATQNQQNQLNRYLLNKIIFFNQEFEELENQLDKLCQEQWTKKSALQQVIGLQPKQLFQFETFRYMYIIVNEISPSCVQKILKEEIFLLQLVQMIQIFTQKNLKQVARCLLENASGERVNDIKHYFQISERQQCFTKNEKSAIFKIFCLLFNFNIEEWRHLTRHLSEGSGVRKNQRISFDDVFITQKNEAEIKQELIQPQKEVIMEAFQQQNPEAPRLNQEIKYEPSIEPAKATNQPNQQPALEQNQIQIQTFEQKQIENPPEVIHNIDIYPCGLQISLEEFNISLALMNEEQQNKIIADWIDNIRDAQYFKGLIPFFFNILKRGEKFSTFLSLINQTIKKRNLSKQMGFFNFKALFQIFYNNSNAELRVMLLKLLSKVQPIPLIYRKLGEKPFEKQFFALNQHVFYVFKESYTIINFSLNENQKRIGKTELINKIFYQAEKFETSDNCEINSQTIDIMFDYSFRGNRNLTVADTHNFVPLDILDQILPLFRLWIIQVDGVKEIQSMLDKLYKLKSFQLTQKRKIFLIIRNSSEDQLLPDNLITEFQNNQIMYVKMEDLTDKSLNKQMIEEDIQNVTNKLYSFIYQQESPVSVNQEDFLEIVRGNETCQEFIQEFQESYSLISEFENELNQMISQNGGFYNKKSFPIRYIEYKIKQLKIQYAQQNSEQLKDQQIKNYSLKEEIDKLEAQIPQQTPTKILQLFCKIFQQSNFYIIYLWFVDKIRQFNEHHTQQLQDQNTKLIESIQALQKQKEELKRRETSDGLDETQRKNIQDINKNIDDFRQKVNKTQEVIAERNIGIELFWREIITFKLKGQDSDLNLDPGQIVHGMIEKGEPFEFLDGDNLKIDQKFLVDLIDKFKNKGNERILVLSILGPQSSGKSTLLNYIFGCHFWTSVGRCTKGIYLQLLKIQNKKYFEDLFDYILLLDTEGLQSPNQQDQEFDKKIALFVLAISDIIIINVKGDIHQSFKSLVEMCMFTLGQMKDYTSLKQLSWCFNQNNDVNAYSQCEDQLQDIAKKLIQNFDKMDEEGKINGYQEILGITRTNIQILGIAQTEKTWRKTDYIGLQNDWRQLIIHEDFTEEAYRYGVRIIKAYSQKFLQQNENQFQNLNNFTEKISQVWQSISRLPDLLEFSELVQHQQNQLMKQEYESLISNFDLNAKIREILQGIHKKISEKGQQVTIMFLEDLLVQKNTETQNALSSIKQDLLEKLLQFKNMHKISKKIFLKYQNMIEERIQSQYLESSLTLINEIKNYEADVQKKNGFKIIDNFISNLNFKPDELSKLQQNPGLIKQKFNELWGEILSEQTKTQEKTYKEFTERLFGMILNEFSNYTLKSKNEEKFQMYFFSNLIKQPPSNQDFDQIFNQFQIELEQQQFMALEKSQQNYQQNEIFHRRFELKLKGASESDIVNLNKFYKKSLLIIYVPIVEMQIYMNEKFLGDLLKYVENQLKYADNQSRNGRQGDDPKKIINNFFSYLVFFGIQIVSQACEQFTQRIIKVIRSPTLYADLQESYQQLAQKITYVPPPQKCPEKHLDTIKKLFKQLVISQEKFECQDMNNDNLESVQLNHVNQNNKIVLDYQIIFSPADHLSQRMINLFSYIQDPDNQNHRQNEFRQNITIFFKEIMAENNLAAWKKLYFTIFTMVVEETLRKEKINLSQIANQDDVDITSYNASLIKLIMAKIQKMILNYNFQFSNFGLILNNIGERCVYYFSIFIIWRLMCFGQWRNISNNLNKLQAQTNDEFQKFQADIKQNKREQSVLRGIALATLIYDNIKENFYLEYSKIAQESAQKLSQFNTSFAVIQHLDSQILEKQNNTITDEQILQYIRNHSDYVEQFVKQKNFEIIRKTQEEYQQLFKNYVKQQLLSVQRNSRNLKNYSLDPIRAEDYFKQKNSNQSIENTLFKIVLSCLQGAQSQFQSLLKDEYVKTTFDITGFARINSPLVNQATNSADQEVQILMHFIKSFDEKLQEHIRDADGISLNFSRLNVTNILDDIKFQQIGCLQTCPICKRKCDQDPKDRSHQHACQNGHQLRGMNSVLIQRSPSLFTCEEIQDDQQIEVLETRNVKKWKEIKDTYRCWQFSCLSNDELQRNKLKFINIWNNKIGQMICKQIEKDLGMSVSYVVKNEIYQHNIVQQQTETKKIHYVLIMDDSGSMQGQRWTNIYKGALAFMGEIKKNQSARITVIIFNNDARCAIDFEPSDPDNQKSRIQFNGGGTNFDNAFLLALQKMASNPLFDQFEMHKMFFYTDGGDQLPQQAITSFSQLPKTRKNKIQLIACTEEKNSMVLEQLVNALKKIIYSAELRNSIQPEKVGQILVEMISNKYHNLMNC